MIATVDFSLVNPYRSIDDDPELPALVYEKGITATFGIESEHSIPSVATLDWDIFVIVSKQHFLFGDLWAEAYLG